MVPLPQSKSSINSSVSMSVAGPKRWSEGKGEPVPSNVTLKSEAIDRVMVM